MTTTVYGLQPIKDNTEERGGSWKCRSKLMALKGLFFNKKKKKRKEKRLYGLLMYHAEVLAHQSRVVTCQFCVFFFFKDRYHKKKDNVF